MFLLLPYISSSICSILILILLFLVYEVLIFIFSQIFEVIYLWIYAVQLLVYHIHIHLVLFLVYFLEEEEEEWKWCKIETVPEICRWRRTTMILFQIWKRFCICFWNWMITNYVKIGWNIHTFIIHNLPEICRWTTTMILFQIWTTFYCFKYSLITKYV